MLKSIVVRVSVLGIVLMGVSAAWGTPVIIDPDVGWSGYFLWNQGVGPIAGISEQEFVYGHQEDWVLGDTEWSITLSTPGVMSLLQTADIYYPAGDQLALRVDGVVVPWTNSYNDPDGYFRGEYHDLALSAGTHSITFDVTAICAPLVPRGSASAYFSPIAGSAAPVPGAIVLSSLGAGLVGWLRNRRRL